MCSKCLTAHHPSSFLAWGLKFLCARALTCFATDLVLHLGLELVPQGMCVVSASWYRWMGSHVLPLNSTPPSSHSVINGLLVDKSPLRLREGAARQTMAARQSMPQGFSFTPLSPEPSCFSFIHFHFGCCVYFYLSVSKLYPIINEQNKQHCFTFSKHINFTIGGLFLYTFLQLKKKRKRKKKTKTYM